MTEPVRIPHGLEPLPHQRELFAAFQAGARRMIARWHRQAGKGLAALTVMVMGALKRPGLYVFVSPTYTMSQRNMWDAIRSDGARYLDIIPPELVLAQNESEMSIDLTTQVAGQSSRLLFASADRPDTLRGLSLAGAVVDEYATMDGRDALDILRPSIERSGAWLLVTSTPKGLNHFHELWTSVEDDPAWWCSVQTIEDTGLIPTSVVDQELREGQSREWLDQEYYVRFTTSLAGGYYADCLTAAEQEARITDLPHRSLLKVWTGWDIGISDLTVIVYFQPMREPGDRVHVLRADAFEGATLAEILAAMGRHGYVFGKHLVPHDAGHREKGTGKTYVDVGRELGVKLDVTPRLDLLEGISQVRALFPRLVFDRRGCARLLEALGAYTKLWDARGKVFRPGPAHTWASHYADALRTFALGYRERDVWDLRPRRPYIAKGVQPLVARRYGPTYRW